VAEAADRMGAPRTPPRDPDLHEPDMWPAYRTLRHLREDGGLRPEGTACALLAVPTPDQAGSGTSEQPEQPAPTAAGRVSLGAGGALGRVLGADLELPLPAPVREVLAAAAARWPDAAPLLLEGGRPLPAVYCAGRPIGPDEPVHAGDCLELVLAISGG